jgi:hypothetical protein
LKTTNTNVKKNTLSIGMKHQHEKEHQCEEHQQKDNTKKKKKCNKTKEKIALNFDPSTEDSKQQTLMRT